MSQPFIHNPTSISFLWHEPVLFSNKDTQVPLVLHGQAVLDVHRDVKLERLLLNFSGTSSRCNIFGEYCCSLTTGFVTLTNNRRNFL